MKFGLSGGARFWCEKCTDKSTDAVYINNTYCCESGCNKLARWAPGGVLENRVCRPHRKDGVKYVDVTRDLCSCGKRMNFNYPGETVGIACKECKKEGMENVTAPKCPCGKQMIYNYPGETVGVACKECKKEGMEDVVNKLCPCGKQMAFNYPGQTRGVACVNCKKDGMENVVTPRCSCGKRMSYNYPGETVGVACQKCKDPGMENVMSPVCPGYGGVSCPVKTYICNGRQYCSSCDPDPKRAQSRKKLEDAFFKYAAGKIDLQKREFRVEFDRKETVKKFARVDGVVFRGDLIVCIEVDENGHAEDSYACDESRMHLVTGELLQKYPGRDVAWVRVNPTIPDVANQWSKKAKTVREKLFERTVAAVAIAEHGVIYID